MATINPEQSGLLNKPALQSNCFISLTCWGFTSIYSTWGRGDSRLGPFWPPCLT